MVHFLLYTPAGSLLLVLVASAVVTVVVWSAVMLVVALAAFALLRLRHAGPDRLPARRSG